jgi:HEAT repeat protein
MIDMSRHPGLDSSDPEQRRQAMARLARTQDADRIDALLLGLGDDDWRVRKEAVSVTLEIGPGADLLDALVATFSRSDNVGLRNAVTEALGGFGRASVERLTLEMAVLDADGRKLVAEALGRTGHFTAIAPLSRLLADGDPNVRVAALESIGCVGATRVELVQQLLEQALASASQLEQLAALEAINALGIVLSWEQLRDAIQDPVLERAALMAAARSADKSAAEPLVAALGRQAALGENWPVIALSEYVTCSFEALESARSQLAAIAPEVRAFLYQLADSDDVESRRSALVVVGALGDDDASRWLLDVAEREELSGGADHLLGALASLSPSIIEERLIAGSVSQRTILLRTLSRNPNLLRRSLIMDAIAVALSSDDEDLLRVALEVLESTSDEYCFRLLIGKLNALPSGLRRTAVVVLQEMALRHVELARTIATKESREGGDTFAAAVLIGALAAGGYGTTPLDLEFLGQCLLNDYASVRCAAIDALASIGDPSSQDALAFSLADEELEVRLAAVRALGCLRDERGLASVVDRLIALLQRTDDRELLVATIQALGDAADPRALSVLRPIAKSGEPAAAVAAVEAIGQIQDPRRIEALIEGLSHHDVEVVKATMGVLASECDVRVEAHLGACLDHEAWDVRRLAVDLLGSRGGDVALSLLRAKCATEREPLVNEAIERVMGYLDGTGSVRRSQTTTNQGSWRPR